MMQNNSRNLFMIRSVTKDAEARSIIVLDVIMENFGYL